MPSDPQSIRSLRAYYNVPIHTLDIEELKRTFDHETDRSLVVVFASVLDDALAQMLRSKLRVMEPKEEKDLRLFSHDGPFGTFSARITTAYAMALIDAHTRDDLQDLREMRNACAHCFKAMDFATPELVAVCMRLFNPEREAIEFRGERTKEELRPAFLFKFIDILLTITLGSREAARSYLIGVAIQKGAELPEP